MDCRSCLEALNLLQGKPPALRGLSSQLKLMKKDTLVLHLIAFGLLRRLRVDHFGSHAVAGLPNLLPSQAIISRSELSNRKSFTLAPMVGSMNFLWQRLTNGTSRRTGGDRILFSLLASDASSFITGQVLHPNGGEIVNSHRRE